MALRLAARTVSAQAAALMAMLTGGELRIYAGAQPADADTPADDRQLLAELPLGGFEIAAPGVITAESIDTARALASGAPGWFRVVDAAGATLLDGAVDDELVLPAESITVGQPVALISFAHTVVAQ